MKWIKFLFTDRFIWIKMRQFFHDFQSWPVSQYQFYLQYNERQETFIPFLLFFNWLYYALTSCCLDTNWIKSHHHSIEATIPLHKNNGRRRRIKALSFKKCLILTPSTLSKVISKESIQLFTHFSNTQKTTEITKE